MATAMEKVEKYEQEKSILEMRVVWAGCDLHAQQRRHAEAVQNLLDHKEAWATEALTDD